MSDTGMMIMVAAGLAGFLILVAVTLKGWTAWLDLKRAELDAGTPRAAPSPAARIELADLKARVRRLEAIADGVE